MDEFEKRLKRDAHAVRAEVSPELKNRIDASLHGMEPILPPTTPERPPTGLWWASSLTGLAAAAAIIVLMNLDRAELPPAETESVAGLTVPSNPEAVVTSPILDVRTADFASPLEEELVKLQSDIEKARESVRKDLDFTF